MASSSASGPAESGRREAAPSPESFDSLRRRNGAAEILQSYEKLSWHAFQRCETITQTRMHFQCIVAGFTAEDEQARICWKEDFTPHPRHECKSGGKGKKRASVAGGAADAKGSSGHRSRHQCKKKNKAPLGGEGSASLRGASKDGATVKAGAGSRGD